MSEVLEGWDEEVRRRIDKHFSDDKDDTIRDLRERVAELERDNEMFHDKYTECCGKIVPLQWENEELACALRDERMEVARLGGCILGVCHMNEQARAQRDESRRQCNEWEKAWDELFSHVSVYVRYGTASFNDREMCRRMDRLDPRNKEKG